MSPISEEELDSILRRLHDPCQGDVGARRLLLRLRSDHVRDVARTAAGIRGIIRAGGEGGEKRERLRERLRAKESERLESLQQEEKALAEALEEALSFVVGDRRKENVAEGGLTFRSGGEVIPSTTKVGSPSNGTATHVATSEVDQASLPSRPPKKTAPPPPPPEDPRERGKEQTTGIKGNDVSSPSCHRPSSPSSSQRRTTEAEREREEANNIGEEEGGGGETDDERPPRARRRRETDDFDEKGEGKRKSMEKGGVKRHPRKNTLSGWSDEDRRVFLREVTRWRTRQSLRGKGREDLVEAVWSSTSGQVYSREAVEAAVGEWELEEERRGKARVRVRRWREERVRRDQEERERAKKIEVESEKKSPNVFMGDKERERKKEEVREWREMEAIKRDLKSAGRVLEKAREAMRREERDMTRRRENARGRSNSFHNGETRKETTSLGEELSPIDFKLKREMSRAQEILRRERAEETVAKWLQNKKRAAEKKVGSGGLELPSRKPLVVAERDFGRLVRTSKRSGGNSIFGGGGGNSGGYSSTDVDSLTSRAVPEWRRGLQAHQSSI